MGSVASRDGEGQTASPILVLTCSGSKAVFAHVMPSKVVSDYMVRTAVEDIDGTGLRRIVLKSDQESVPQALIARVKAWRTHETIPEDSPAYEPQSNGVAENAVQHVKGMCRVMKDALDTRYGHVIDPKHHVLT